MSDKIKWFAWNMAGAPQMNQTHGEMAAVLDACLSDGFNPKVISGITRVGTTATATAAGHGYQPNMVVLIAGADQADYNGEVTVKSATLNTFSFDVVGTPATPATTATVMSAKVAPLGFTKVFSNGHKRAYRSPNVLSPRHYLRIDNGPGPAWVAGRGIDCKVYSAESMTDIDTMVNPCPRDAAVVAGTMLEGWIHWYQAMGTGAQKTSTNHGSAARQWVIVGCDRALYIFNNCYTPHGRFFGGWGEFSSLRPNDQYRTFLAGPESYNLDTSYSVPHGANGFGCHNNVASQHMNGQFLQRPFHGTGNPARFFPVGLFTPGLSVYNTSGNGLYMTHPDPISGSVVLSPRYLHEANVDSTVIGYRGVLPGNYAALTNRPYQDLEVLDNVIGLPGRKFLVVQADAMHTNSMVNSQPEINAARWLFDLTGPWFI